jgi:hypothetical protein
LVLYPTGSINLGFKTEGKLAVVLIITFSWGFQQVFWRQLHASKTAIKLHADKFPGAIVRSVAKLAGINLRKFGSLSYWFDKPWFQN